jgi:uncharacterized protein with HEPN domain
MSDDESMYMGHMLDMALQAIEISQGKEKQDFNDDTNLRLALTHIVQVIGEAARRVPEKIRQKHPSIPWKEIVGMRSKIVHDYMSVDEDAVWKVVTEELPDLVDKLENIVPPFDDEE